MTIGEKVIQRKQTYKHRRKIKIKEIGSFYQEMLGTRFDKPIRANSRHMEGIFLWITDLQIQKSKIELDGNSKQGRGRCRNLIETGSYKSKQKPQKLQEKKA